MGVRVGLGVLVDSCSGSSVGSLVSSGRGRAVEVGWGSGWGVSSLDLGVLVGSPVGCGRGEEVGWTRGVLVGRVVGLGIMVGCEVGDDMRVGLGAAHGLIACELPCGALQIEPLLSIANRTLALLASGGKL